MTRPVQQPFLKSDCILAWLAEGCSFDSMITMREEKIKLRTSLMSQVGLGEFLHQLDDRLPNFPVPIDDVLAVVLLVFFGVQTLKVRLLLVQ